MSASFTFDSFSFRTAFQRHGRRRRVIPGFTVTTGLTVAYVSLIVLIPLATLVVSAAALGPAQLWATVSTPRAVAAFQLSFGTALVAATLDVPIGFLVAWVLVRYRFPGRGAIDAMIDLPFALPTAVTGITLAALYAEQGWIGAFLASVGVRVSYTWLGITVVLAFIGLPFVVRSVQPVLASVERELEEAAQVLGAGRWQTVRRVILPPVLPAVVSGMGLAFARGLGEYGSVVFISGNMPFHTEIAPLLIVTRLEEYNEAGATAIALVLLMSSFVALLLFNRMQRVLSRGR
jgi:sulfate transport system permease protein